MSGIALQQALVANGHKIPVIFISAFSWERFKARLTSSNAICFLRKPFEFKGANRLPGNGATKTRRRSLRHRDRDLVPMGCRLMALSGRANRADECPL